MEGRPTDTLERFAHPSHAPRSLWVLYSISMSPVSPSHFSCMFCLSPARRRVSITGPCMIRSQRDALKCRKLPTGELSVWVCDLPPERASSRDLPDKVDRGGAYTPASRNRKGTGFLNYSSQSGRGGGRAQLLISEARPATNWTRRAREPGRKFWP